MGVLRDEVILFDLSTNDLKPARKCLTFPSPHPYGVLALSGHWIAYAARELPDGATEVVGSDAVSAVGAMGKSLSMVEMLGSTLSVWSGSLVGSAAPPVDEPML